MEIIAFVALDDPYMAGSLSGISQKGPILRTLEKTNAKKILLLAPNERLAAAKRLHKELKVHHQTLPLSTSPNPSLSEIVRILETHTPTLKEFSDAIILSTGTAQERAALWLLKEKGILTGSVIDPPSAVYGNAQTYLVREPHVHFGSTQKHPNEACNHPPSWITTAAKTGCIGHSPQFERTLEEAATLANHPTPILLMGETGCGKEVLARFIHASSSRSEEDLVAVNCAALPESLAESILFGHEKGAFTGAYKRQKGKFELAHKGTLFLDELGELSLPNQAKLLRVIEEHSVDLLGGDKPIKVDVRIIAATNRNLAKEVEEGRFREDLYYRLKAGGILIPPLRERKGDISLIAQHLLQRFNSTLAIPKHISSSALRFLEQQSWPGNVRDLLNTLERTVLLCPRTTIEPEDFKIDTPLSHKKRDILPKLEEGFSMEAYLQRIRHNLIQKAIQQANGNRSEAARLLGVTPQAIHKHIKNYEIKVKYGEMVSPSS